MSVIITCWNLFSFVSATYSANLIVSEISFVLPLLIISVLFLTKVKKIDAGQAVSILISKVA